MPTEPRPSWLRRRLAWTPWSMGHISPARLWKPWRRPGTVWVPTLATIGNLRGTGRFSEADVTRILTSAQENVARFHALGGLLAPGSDAGAYAVFHGQGGLDEYRLLSEALGPEAGDALSQGISAIRQRF